MVRINLKDKFLPLLFVSFLSHIAPPYLAGRSDQVSGDVHGQIWKLYELLWSECSRVWFQLSNWCNISWGLYWYRKRLKRYCPSCTDICNYNSDSIISGFTNNSNEMTLEFCLPFLTTHTYQCLWNLLRFLQYFGIYMIHIYIYFSHSTNLKYYSLIDKKET